VAEGEIADVLLDFTEPQPPTPPTNGQTTAPPTAPPLAGSHGSRVRWYTYAAFGVGVVGLGFGGVTGALAMSARDAAVRDGCNAGRCPPPAQGDEHNSQNMATFSTIGFAVGLAGVTAGLITLFLPPGGSDSAAAATTSSRGKGPPPSNAWHAHLEVGPGFLGVAGDL
jgi:hypothetical protein